MTFPISELNLKPQERAALEEVRTSLVKAVAKCQGVHTTLPTLMAELVEAALSIDFVLPTDVQLSSEELSRLRHLRGRIYEYERFAA